MEPCAGLAPTPLVKNPENPPHNPVKQAESFGDGDAFEMRDLDIAVTASTKTLKILDSAEPSSSTEDDSSRTRARKSPKAKRKSSTPRKVVSSADTEAHPMQRKSQRLRTPAKLADAVVDQQAVDSKGAPFWTALRTMNSKAEKSRRGGAKKSSSACCKVGKCKGRVAAQVKQAVGAPQDRGPVEEVPPEETLDEKESTDEGISGESGFTGTSRAAKRSSTAEGKRGRKGSTTKKKSHKAGATNEEISVEKEGTVELKPSEKSSTAKRKPCKRGSTAKEKSGPIESTAEGKLGKTGGSTPEESESSLEEQSSRKEKERAKTKKKVVHKKRPCEVCGRCYNTFYMKVHMRKHTGEKPFICPDCAHRFSTESLLRTHSQRYHGNTEALHCDVCRKVFASKGSLKIHRQIHSDEKPHKCQLCDKEFKQLGVLNEHRKTHSGDFPFICEVCGKRFKSKRSVLRHKEAAHDGVRSCFLCTACGKVFTDKSSLWRHQKRHEQGYAKQVCEVCGKQFHERKVLATHMLIHENKKPFECDVCLKRFRHYSVLKRHMCCHTGVKPFRCDKCQRQFIHRVYMLRHKCAAKPAEPPPPQASPTQQTTPMPISSDLPIDLNQDFAEQLLVDTGATAPSEEMPMVCDVHLPPNLIVEKLVPDEEMRLNGDVWINVEETQIHSDLGFDLRPNHDNGEPLPVEQPPQVVADLNPSCGLATVHRMRVDSGVNLLPNHRGQSVCGSVPALLLLLPPCSGNMGPVLVEQVQADVGSKHHAAIFDQDLLAEDSKLLQPIQAVAVPDPASMSLPHDPHPTQTQLQTLVPQPQHEVLVETIEVYAEDGEGVLSN